MSPPMRYSAAGDLDVAADFRYIMSLSPTPVTVVTALTETGPEAVVIGSFVSVSIEPPLIGFFVGKATQMWQPMRAAAAYCVNILAADQGPLSNLFVSHDVDRFDRTAWEAAGNGAPTLDDVVAWIECKPYTVADAGDHDLILLEVTGLRQGRESGPLIYHRGRYSGVAHIE